MRIGDERFIGKDSNGLVEDGVNDCYGGLELPTDFNGNLEMPADFDGNFDSLGEFDELDCVLNYDLMEKDGVIGDWDVCEWKGPETSSLNDFMPIEKTPDAKQLLNYVQDDSGSHIYNIADNFQESSYVYHPTSPVSELESSGSCSTTKLIPIKSSIAGPRSKRARPSTRVTKWSAIVPLPAPASKKASNPRKNTKITKKVPQPSFSMEDDLQNDPACLKKCTHCQITKTPQWREGPNGPKTLCNACGVRYRSGRLFPEYRPAASPTFVPQLHSNSHKKVIEMRNKGKRCFTQTEEPFVCPELEYHPLRSYGFEF